MGYKFIYGWGSYMVLRKIEDCNSEGELQSVPLNIDIAKESYDYITE